jgi:hypothetical protein
MVRFGYVLKQYIKSVLGIYLSEEREKNMFAAENFLFARLSPYVE